MINWNFDLRGKRLQGYWLPLLAVAALAASFLIGRSLSINVAHAGNTPMNVKHETISGNHGIPHTGRKGSAPSKNYNAWKHLTAFPGIMGKRGMNEREKKDKGGTEEDDNGDQ